MASMLLLRQFYTPLGTSPLLPRVQGMALDTGVLPKSSTPLISWYSVWGSALPERSEGEVVPLRR